MESLTGFLQAPPPQTVFPHIRLDLITLDQIRFISAKIKIQ